MRGPHALAAVVVLVIGIAVALALSGAGRPRASPPTGPIVTSIPPPKTTANPPDRRVTRLDRFADLGYPLYCGGSQKRLVALTFDDGPGPYTSALVDVLRAHRARASFFLVGNRIPEYLKLPAEEAAVGALGNHTWSHADLTKLPPRLVAAQLDQTIAEVSLTAHTDVRLFRPPYEAHNASIDAGVRARHMLEVLWSIDGTDYNHALSAAQIAERIAAKIKPGSIVVLHDIQPHTVDAVRLLLPVLHRRKLRPVSIPELVRLDPPSRERLAAGFLGCLRA